MGGAVLWHPIWGTHPRIDQHLFGTLPPRLAVPPPLLLLSSEGLMPFVPKM